MDWKHVWAVKLKCMECGISLWSNPSWQKPEAFSMACQHSAGCNLFSLRLWWESFKRRTAATFLRPQKVSWIFFDLICCAQKSFVPISPCRTAITELVDHLAVSAICSGEGKDDSKDGQRPKYCKRGAWAMGFTPVTCFSHAGSTEFLRFFKTNF